MSSSLFPPDVRRLFGELERRVGILERRVQPRSAAATAGDRDPYRVQAAILFPVVSVYVALETAEFLRFPSAPSATLETTLTISSGPYTLSAGGHIYPVIFNPLVDGTLTIFAADLLIYNPAVTERLRLRYAMGEVVDPNGSWGAPSTATAPTTDMAIGTDIQMSTLANVNRAKTVAGGIYSATLMLTLQYTPA